MCLPMLLINIQVTHLFESIIVAAFELSFHVVEGATLHWMCQLCRPLSAAKLFIRYSCVNELRLCRECFGHDVVN